MRFDKETRAAIQEAAPHPATIRWPSGAPEPEKGRVYWLQAVEEEKAREEKDKRRRQEHPETHADVMAQMHETFYGRKPKGYKPKRRARRPQRDVPRIRVLDTTILERGWEATVELFEVADPVQHVPMKAVVPAGPHPIFGYQEKVQTEPEGMVVAPSRSEREDLEDALKAEHAVSVDHAELARLERKLANERHRGKPGKMVQAAVERARRRVEQTAAGLAV